MTEPDVLTRAAKALRSAHTGEREGSGFTRARIMSTLHQKRRGRLLRWGVLSPLASVLLVGSAWAHSTGKWPAVWQAVTSVFVSAPEESDRGRSSARSLRAGQPEPLLKTAPPTTEAPKAREPSPPLAPAELEQAGSDASERGAFDTDSAEPAPSSARRRVTARTAPEPAPAADPELSRFRAAHELHFRANRPRQAIAAYAAYLEQFPNGRFVPEARYNTALNWIKLGDKAAARAALAPFADGTFGEYRRAEAKQLLEALR